MAAKLIIMRALFSLFFALDMYIHVYTYMHTHAQASACVGIVCVYSFSACSHTSPCLSYFSFQWHSCRPSPCVPQEEL